MAKSFYDQLAKIEAEKAAVRMRALQADMWDKSDLVLVARVEQEWTTSIPYLDEARQVDFAPLYSLKGQAGPWQFSVGITGTTSCGPIGVSAAYGRVGDQYVVFVRGDTPTRESVLLTLKPNELVEPRALAALKAQD